MITINPDGILNKETLPKNILYQENNPREERNIYTFEELEKGEIKRALNIYGNDTFGKSIAAEKLGIGIATLYRKIEKYKLNA